MEKKIKILRIITRLNIGGPAQHAIFLTESLNKDFFESKLIIGSVNSNEGDMSFLARDKGLSLIEITELQNEGGLLSDFRAFLKLYRIIRKERPHIIHLHLFKARILGGLAAKLAGVPIIIQTFHGHVFREYYDAFKTAIILLIERFIGRFVTDEIIAISDNQKEDLIQFGISKSDKIRVMSIGLELDRFLNVEEKRGELRRELDLSDECTLVGIVGRLVPIKGHLYFLRAAKDVLDTLGNSRVRFLIIGDGELRKELESQCRELGIEKSVIFLGWRNDLERIYADLDVVVLSSLNEGTPVSVIEAMASGKAVAATKVGGVSDIIKDGVSGILVPSKDHISLAQAIIKLLNDPKLRLTLGNEGRKRVYPEYDVSNLVKNMENFYMDLSISRSIYYKL